MDVVSIGETMVLFTPNVGGQLRYTRNFSSKIIVMYTLSI